MKQFLRKFAALQRLALGMNERNAALIYPHNPRKQFALADDKLLTKQVLEAHGISCAETYAVIRSVGQVASGWASVQSKAELAIKPAHGRGGGGILVLKKGAGGQWEKGGKPMEERQILQHLGSIVMGAFSGGEEDTAILEYCIQPHPFFGTIFPGGVPDFRVILLKGRPLIAMLRMPTLRSDGKANLHQGGIGIGIDMEAGCLREGFYRNAYCDRHPDSGVVIRGLPIPQWPEMLAVACKTAAAFPLEYLGVDIVLDKDRGPMVLEINVRPGLAVQLANGTGLLTTLTTNA